MHALMMIALQAAADAAPAGTGVWQWIKDFVDTPAPYSPFSEYLLVLFVLWLLARRDGRRQGDFGRQAQDVLDEKYQQGEITKEAYDKYRQDISLRPRH